MSRLIWIYAVCKSLLLSPVAVKELKPCVDVIRKKIAKEKLTLIEIVILHCNINIIVTSFVKKKKKKKKKKTMESSFLSCYILLRSKVVFCRVNVLLN